MRGRRRYRVPRRPRIPPPATIAPVAQHRGGNPQLACDPAQRPTAAYQQGYRFPLELIGKMTPSLAHSTPFHSPRSLAKVSTNPGESHSDSPPDARNIVLTSFARIHKYTFAWRLPLTAGNWVSNEPVEPPDPASDL